MNVERAKRRAGEAAAETVTDGSVVGLGTGSTAAHTIRALGERVADGLDVRGVPTSLGTRELAREAGVPLTSLSDVESVDVAIDGADQVLDDAGSDRSPGEVLVKGGGGAHLREKVVASSADSFLVVVDARKLTEAIDHPIPLEVLPVARSTVARRVRDLGGEPSLRRAERKDGPVVTDNGNLLIDADFGPIAGSGSGSTDDPATLAGDLAGIPGLLEHGLFVDFAETIYVGTATDVDVLEE
jgi:ribose 5-phosphate isomerase A